MPDVALPKVILLDGPLAGFLCNVPPDTHWWNVVVPKRLDITEMLREPAKPVPTEYATYTIQAGRFNPAAFGIFAVGDLDIRVGTLGSELPRHALLMDFVPTGLAEQGLLPWFAVRDTPDDRFNPIELQDIGDPLLACDVNVGDPFRIPVDEIDASCTCGWRTERVPFVRRSQLVRMAHRHAAGQEARRERYKLPIRVLNEGSGLTDTCLAGYDFDKATGLVAASCRVCGWRTEQVEQYRGKPLGELRAAHIGPDGVRHARNRLLTAYGLPVPTVEEEEAMRRG